MPKIYTKTGDAGQTGLLGGKRVSKSDGRIDLYGDVDELNSFLGLLISELKSPSLQEGHRFLREVQRELFVLGSLLATEASERESFKLPGLAPAFVRSIENQIDLLEARLPPLRNFLLPGTGTANALTHVLRSITRRVERKLVEFEERCPSEKVDGSVIFLNRLSDFFFVLSRFITKEHSEVENLWPPTV